MRRTTTPKRENIRRGISRSWRETIGRPMTVEERGKKVYDNNGMGKTMKKENESERARVSYFSLILTHSFYRSTRLYVISISLSLCLSAPSFLSLPFYLLLLFILSQPPSLPVYISLIITYTTPFPHFLIHFLPTVPPPPTPYDTKTSSLEPEPVNLIQNQ